MPVFSSQSSYFTELDFVTLDYVDWRWMDLDRKYEWETESIKMFDHNDTTFQIVFNKDDLKIASYDQKFDYCTISFNQTKSKIKISNGYCNFENYSFQINDKNKEFIDIKVKNSLKLTRFCHMQITKYFKLTKNDYIKVNLQKIKDYSSNDLIKQALEDDGYFHKSKRIKLAYD